MRPVMAINYLGLQLPEAQAAYPEVKRCGPQRPASAGPPCLALLRMGFTKPAKSPWPLVSSYLTVSPLPRTASGRSAVCFLLHFP